MSGPTLDHVQIAAPPGCEPAARHFFGDLLGLVELPKPAPLSAASIRGKSRIPMRPATVRGGSKPGVRRL